MTAALLAALVVALLLGWYLSWAASRLDRLHGRVEGARSALDAQLQRRASATSQLATSGLLDPASAVLLVTAAHDAREAEPADQDRREGDLTAALAAALAELDAPAIRAEAVGRDLLDELAAACRRVELARRFHNDAVRAARAVRRKRLVRAAHLAGRAPAPVTVDFDAAVPPELLLTGLLTPGARGAGAYDEGTV